VRENALVSKEFRYRVTYADGRSSDFAVTGRDFRNIAGKASAPEIIERLKTELSAEDLDTDGILAALESLDPADASESAVLPLSERLQLEVLVRSRSTSA
jgi:hypothetical protein